MGGTVSFDQFMLVLQFVWQTVLIFRCYLAMVQALQVPPTNSVGSHTDAVNC